MDLTWTSEQRELYERMRGLAGSKASNPSNPSDAANASDAANPSNPSNTENGDGRAELTWEELGEAGVMALPIPGEYGGLGMSPLTCALAMEGLGYGCGDTGLLIGAGAHMWAAELPLLIFGTDEQRLKYLPSLASGRSVGAHAITEAGSGSDALAMETTARKEGTSYVLNGRKRFVSNAPDADVFVVYATLGSQYGFTGVTAFLVERGHPGLSVEPEFEKVGLRSLSWGQVVLEDCILDEGMRLGGEKQGSQVFASVMAWERTMLLAPLLGGMERQIEECVARANERRQFGRRIGANQSVSNRIVEMQLRLETSRGLVRTAAAALGPSSGTRGHQSFLPELVKLHVSESAAATYEDAMQIFGSHGFTERAKIAERLTDALGTKISSGTSDMQREVVAAKLGLR